MATTTGHNGRRAFRAGPLFAMVKLYWRDPTGGPALDGYPLRANPPREIELSCSDSKVHSVSVKHLIALAVANQKVRGTIEFHG